MTLTDLPAVSAFRPDVPRPRRRRRARRLAAVAAVAAKLAAGAGAALVYDRLMSPVS